MFKSLIVIAFLLNTFFVVSQTTSYRHYGVEDGLPSSEVYTVIKDQKGYMWFGTDRGIARFDGSEFDVYTTDDGLLNNLIFHIQEDHLGRIWFVSYTGEISYFFENEIHEYAYNEVINEFSKRKQILSFFVDEQSKLYLGLYRKSFITIDSTGFLEKLDLGSTPNDLYVIDRQIGFSTDHEFYKDSLNYLGYFANNTTKKLLIPEISREKETVPIHQEVIVSAAIDPENNDVYFSIWNLLYKINAAQITLIKKMDQQILDLSVGKENVVVMLRGGGFKVFNKKVDYALISEGLDGYSITDYNIDENKNSCFTTLENGVFFFKDSEFISYNKSNFLPSDNILKVNGSSKEILFGDDKSNLTVMNLSSGLTKTFYTIDKLTSIKGISYDEKADKFYILNYGLSVYQNGETRNLTDDHIFDLTFLGKDSLLILDTVSAISLKNERDDLYFEVVLSNRLAHLLDKDGYTFSSFTKQGDDIFFGGLEGLYKIGDEKFIHLAPLHKLFQYRIIKFCQLNNDAFCFATRGAGLVYYNDGKPYNVSKKDGLISNQLTAITKDKNGDLWVGSSEGLSIIKADQKTIINLTKVDGLISNEVNDIFLNRTHAYIATKFGISVIDKTKVNPIIEDIPIYLNSLKLSDTLIKLQAREHSIIVDYKEPFIEVKFIGISYGNPNKTNYRYRLNEDDSWKYTTNNKIVFSNLGSGEYTLEISASMGHDTWSKSPAILAINVRDPYWKKTGFILFSSLLIIALFALIFYLIFKRIQRQELNKRKIQSLKIEVLNAQMNPHFIFNSLNSIQSFILKNDIKSSNRYLSKFAKLMRMTLDQTKETNVVLTKELELINLYMELENVRFEYSIESEIIIDENINSNRMLIPSLLIQPLVENAIWHGLLPSPNKKKVTLSFERKNEDVIIEIEDNGVGRKAAALNSKSDHISKGNKLVRDRLNLFAKEYQSESAIEVFDLNQSGEAVGTRIRLQIPYIQKDEL